MKVRSPKSGFVMQLFVKDQEHVAVGSPLLQMDSDAEDRYTSHLEILDKMRELKASQYIGPEVEVTRSLAQVAVDTSAKRAKDESEVYGYYVQLAKQGVANIVQYAPAESTFEQARWEHTRAEGQQQRLEFSISRYIQLNDLAKKWNMDQRAFVALRKARLKVLAPITGKVSVFVAEGSYAKYGNVIMEVKAP
jgi:multidrug resistance efflux pump